MNIFILENSSHRIAQFLGTLHKHDVTLCSTYEAAIESWKPPYDLMLLDHDLGGHQFVSSDGEEMTGAHFATWLITNPNAGPLPPTIVHSYNLNGAKRIQAILQDAGVGVIREPFGPNLIKFLEKQ